MEIIGNFLDFNRLDDGRIKLENRVFSLFTALEEHLSLFTVEMKKKNLVFEKHIDREIPPFLRGDPYRLMQVIANILHNAMKFSDEGKVSFTVSQTRNDGESCMLLFQIRDQGIGIAPEQLKEIYTPFSQAAPGISRQFGGSGLGLAICYRLIELMEGSINIDSREGEGTLVTFSVPFTISPEREEAEKPGLKHMDSFKGARLLYAEDNPLNREIGRELFRMAGLDIETAENGREAVEKVMRNRFDLVLMDIQMPFMDGLTATGIIRMREKEQGLPRLPVVALSAHFLEEDIQKAMEAGMDDYLTKPISINDVNALFSKWLDRFCVRTRKTHFSREEPFASIPGIDMDDVMERFGGNYGLLRDSLGNFVTDYALMPAILLSMDPESDRAKIGKKVHTLKGVLGSLGAEDLFREADDLEIQLKNGEECPDEIRKFSRNLEDFINRLEGKF